MHKTKEWLINETHPQSTLPQQSTFAYTLTTRRHIEFKPTPYCCCQSNVLKIDGYMLLCVWPTLNPLSIHVTFTAIIPGSRAYPGEAKMCHKLIAETDARSVGDSHPSCWVMLRTNRQTDKQTDGAEHTHADRLCRRSWVINALSLLD